MSTDATLQIQVTSLLVHDYIASDEVIVDPSGQNQVSVFRNPDKSGTVEALLVPQVGEDATLCYLARSTTSTTGWELNTLSDADGNEILASGVAVVATTWGTLRALYLDPDGQLMQLDWDGSAWGSPAAVSGAPAGLGTLSVVYSPGATASSGQVICYGATSDGQLFVLYGDDGAFTSATIALGVTWESGVLSFLDTEGSWLATVVQVEDSALGAYAWWQGSGTSLTTSGGSFAGQPTGTALYQATAMAGSTDAMVLMIVDADVDGVVTPVLSWIVDPNVWPVSGSLQDVTLTTAAVVESTSGYVSVYGIDSDLNLFVIHQVAFDPSAMGSGFSTGQTWGPQLQLAAGVAAVYADPMPSDAPTIVSVDDALGAITVHSLDPTTRLWSHTPIRLATETRYELSRWRTKATVYDASGSPAAGLALELGASSAVEVEVNGSFVFVDSETTASLVTDARGQVTVASLATSLTSPALTFTAEDLDPTDHSPSGGVNAWFAGTGSLPGKDAFSADSLSSATVNGAPLAPGLTDGSLKMSADDAAQLIAGCAALGQGTAPADGADLVHVYQTVDGKVVHTSYADRAAMSAAQASAAQSASATTVWSDCWDFAGDLWSGILSGLHAVESVTVDLAESVVRLTVWIGDELVQLADWVIEGVEDALQAIGAVFAWILAAIEDVIQWLEALFDLAAIWRTKAALQSGLDQLVTFLDSQLDAWSAIVDQELLGGLTDQVNEVFDTLIARYDPDAPISSTDGWVAQAPPDTSTPVAGSASQNDLTNNVQGTWFSDQVSNQGDVDLSSVPEGDDSPFQALLDALSAAGDDLLAAFTDFGDGVVDMMSASSITDFGDIVMATFLEVVRDLVLALLALADALVQALLAAASAGLAGLQAALAAPLDIPIIGSLYTWLADLAGSPGETLTLGNLVGLLAAFPVTVVYKLVMGVDQEPFPVGWDQAGDAMAADSAVSTQLQGEMGIVAGSLTCVGVVFDLWNDIAAYTEIKNLNLDKILVPSWVNWGVVALSAFHGVFAAPVYGLNWSAIFQSGGALWGSLLWVGNVADALVQAIAKQVDSDSDNGVFYLAQSFMGVSLLVLACLETVEDSDDTLMTVDSFIAPLPSLFSFVLVSTLRDSEAGPALLALKLAIDLLADIGGGALEIADGYALATSTS